MQTAYDDKRGQKIFYKILMKRLSHFECIRYNRDDIWERGQFAEITIDTNCAQYIKIYQNNRGNAVDEKAKPLERAALPHLFYAGRRIGGHAADPLLFCRAVAQTPLRTRQRHRDHRHRARHCSGSMQSAGFPQTDRAQGQRK